MKTPTPGQWATTKHATPEHSPQYGIYAGDSPHDLATVKGDNAEADAALIVHAVNLHTRLVEALELLDNAINEPSLGIDIIAASDAARATLNEAKGGF